MRKQRMGNIHRTMGERFSSEIREMDLRKVLIVPIDIAKKSSMAMVANYFGDIVVSPFSFPNTMDGAKYLESKMQEAIKSNDAKKVFIAMESTGHYGENLSEHLRQRGYRVMLVNPYVVKLKREGTLTWCKTDNIDLSAIGSVVIDGIVSQAGRMGDLYYNLRLAARAHRRTITVMSSLKTELRTVLDRLFPGLGEHECFGNLGSQSARKFLRCYPTPQKVVMIGKDRLCRICEKKKIYFTTDQITSIVKIAKNALKKQESKQEVLIEILNEKLDDIELMDRKVELWEIWMAKYFVQTPGIWLLRIKYVGVPTASEFIAETGDPSLFSSGSSYIKFAGLEPRKNQSGNFRASHEPITKLGSSRLRNIATIIAQNLMGKNLYFTEFANRLISAGKESKLVRVAVGCKFFKIAHPVMILKEQFVPPSRFENYFSDNIEEKIKEFFKKHGHMDLYNSLIPHIRNQLKPSKTTADINY